MDCYWHCYWHMCHWGEYINAVWYCIQTKFTWTKHTLLKFSSKSVWNMTMTMSKCVCVFLQHVHSSEVVCQVCAAARHKHLRGGVKVGRWTRHYWFPVGSVSLFTSVSSSVAGWYVSGLHILCEVLVFKVTPSVRPKPLLHHYYWVIEGLTRFMSYR